MTYTRFHHVVSVENSRSTQASSSQRYGLAVRQACPEADFSAIPFGDSLASELAQTLANDSLVCISGGDGTVSGVVQTLLEAPQLSAEQRTTPVLPLWCGNANDIAHMLNGRASAAKCKTIVERGNVVPIYPLCCELLAPNGEQTVRLALGYISLGVSAQTAKRLNEPSFRTNPLHAVPGVKPISEIMLLLRAMQSSPSFTVEQNGAQKVVYDWIIGKGPRMAKNVKLPVQLTDRAFYESVVRKSVPEVVTRLGGMAWGLLEPTNNTEPIMFTTQQPVWAQFDGEPLQLTAGTKVTVSLNPEPFYALSTTLPEPATLKA